ncbi:MAG: hypothetical protein HY093_02640 [Candidatus Liptonbacteria bacterium]|nr:hypothetical protein [Candidatus Liptonbacteria bacterium]
MEVPIAAMSSLEIFKLSGWAGVELAVVVEVEAGAAGRGSVVKVLSKE